MQNIWQQIILFSSSVMQMISTWHKIWTLSGRLSLMRNVQLMKTNIYIFRVYNIRIIATTKIGSHDMIQTDSSIIIVGNVCVLTSASMIFSFCSRCHDRQSSDQSFSSRGYDRQSSEQNNRKLISLHNNGEDDKLSHGFADF